MLKKMAVLLYTVWNFKALSYCFKGFDVKASFASRPISRLIKWYNKPGDKQNNFEKRLFSSTGISLDWNFQIVYIFFNVSLNVLRPTFSNIYDLPFLHSPNVGKIRVKTGPKTNYVSYFMIGTSGQNYFIEMKAYIVHQSIEH